MSNFTLQSPSSFVGIFTAVNDYTSGALGIGILLVFFIVNLVTFWHRGLSASASASLFNTMVICLLLMGMGLITGIFPLFLIGGALVASIIWGVYEGQRG